MQNSAPPITRTRSTGQVEFAGVVYLPAGLFLRLGAFLVDFIVLSLLHALLVYVAQVPRPDWGETMSLMGRLLDAISTGGMPSAGLMAEFEDLRRPLMFAGWLNVALCAGYFTIFHGYLNATPGKLALGLSVLRRTGEPLGIGWAFLRYLLYFLCARLAYTAWVIPFDPQRRTFYDMLLGTNVFRRARGA